MSTRLPNKVALITGGASGIGKATAELFVTEGAQVIITDINEHKGYQVATDLGEKAHFFSLDVSNEADWAKLMPWIYQQFKQLDVVVNNAGITGLTECASPQNPENCTLSDWQKVHHINLDGVFLGCKYAIQWMKQHKTGSIINLSSHSGIVGIPGAAAYASSKAAVRNHSKTVALYCAQQGYGIRCNSIHPGAILTPIWDPMLGEDSKREASIAAIAKEIPLQRMGTAEEVAYLILYLAADESAYVTGAEFTIDGGILAGATAAPAKNNFSEYENS
jgi:NAD(P)-dependent dehydrogenase (short-subunit alcohol dehydrogenase family)